MKRAYREGVPASTVQRGRVNELRWQDKHGVVMTDAVWLAVKCNRHRKIVLITRQEASFLIHSLRP